MADGQGVIGKVEEDGLPVIWRFIDRTPSPEEREQLQWLTVISWDYDRDVRNGMPPEDVERINRNDFSTIPRRYQQLVREYTALRAQREAKEGADRDR